MGVRRQGDLPAWTGLGLVVLGFLAFVVSYFLLPVYIITACCGQPAYSPTTWAYSLNGLSHLTISPVTNTGLLVLCYLPLLAAVTVVGCIIVFLMQPQRTCARWSHRAWQVGTIALILLLLVLLFGIAFFSGRPDVGYFGLLFGYGFLWVGGRVVRNSASSA